MAEKKYRWYKIADTIEELEFNDKNIMEVEVAGKMVCVANTLNGLAACAAKCPHAGGRMAAGFVDTAGNIVCPIHRYVFCLKNGRDVSGEGYFLKIYPVTVNDDGIFLGIEEGGLFGWLK